MRDEALYGMLPTTSPPSTPPRTSSCTPPRKSARVAYDEASDWEAIQKALYNRTDVKHLIRYQEGVLVVEVGDDFVDKIFVVQRGVQEDASALEKYKSEKRAYELLQGKKIALEANFYENAGSPTLKFHRIRLQRVHVIPSNPNPKVLGQISQELLKLVNNLHGQGIVHNDLVIRDRYGGKDHLHNVVALHKTDEGFYSDLRLIDFEMAATKDTCDFLEEKKVTESTDLREFLEKTTQPVEVQ